MNTSATLTGSSARSPEALLQAAAKGDASAWEQLVRAYTKRVYGLLVRQCGDRELSEELTQETFVKIVQVLRKKDDEAAGQTASQTASYDEQGKFEPWLFRVAMNVLRDEMRRRVRQAKPMDMSPGAAASAGDGDKASAFAAVEASESLRRSGANDPQEMVSQAEQMGLVQAAISRMSDKERQVMHLRHTAGLSFAEIADALNEPLGTVLACAHRALGKLKKELAPLEA